MNWLSNLFSNATNHPDFWKAYEAAFQQKNNSRVVVLDCETTGLKPTKDKILSIGAIALQNNVICVKDQFSVLLKQDFRSAESIPIHGIVENKRNTYLSEEEAIVQLLQFLGNAKIVGHHIQFDIHMINQALQKLGLPELKNKVQDTNDLYAKFKGVQYPFHKSLDDLCKEFKIATKDRHTALGDAFLTAQIYQRMQIT